MLHLPGPVYWDQVPELVCRAWGSLQVQKFGSGASAILLNLWACLEPCKTEDMELQVGPGPRAKVEHPGLVNLCFSQKFHDFKMLYLKSEAF